MASREYGNIWTGGDGGQLSERTGAGRAVQRTITLLKSAERENLNHPYLEAVRFEMTCFFVTFTLQSITLQFILFITMLKFFQSGAPGSRRTQKSYAKIPSSGS